MTEEKLLIPCLYLRGERAVSGWDSEELFDDGDAVRLARHYGDQGADELLLYDLSRGDAQHEETIGKIKEICGAAEIPVTAAGHIQRAEDVKKLLYAGCAGVYLDLSLESGRAMLREVSQRFGREKIGVCAGKTEDLAGSLALVNAYASRLLVPEGFSGETELPVILRSGQTEEEKIMELLEGAEGVTGDYVSRTDLSFFQMKQRCIGRGLAMRVYESRIPWSAFKLNGDGLVPVIVQDYRTDEVLMLAYMNEEAFDTTIATGRMTYWSRSRGELWVKGLTSGHFQYVKSLSLDCDNDTILAKVDQVGAACHTGSRSCFFQELMKKECDDTNPLHVFQDVYDVILDRKAHPKEGSYTNYLFDKGIDKILKKVGEECTEIVIAAKNPDKEEIKYEISDFLYHVMVLMAEKGVTWEDITRELARR